MEISHDASFQAGTEIGIHTRISGYKLDFSINDAAAKELHLDHITDQGADARLLVSGKHLGCIEGMVNCKVRKCIGQHHCPFCQFSPEMF